MAARPRTAGSSPFTIGGVTLDVPGRRVLVGDQEVVLTRTQFSLLAHLIAHRGTVCTRHQLMSDVWGYQVPIDSRTVDVHMSQLRAKLAGALEIRTVRGAGYVVEDDARPAA